MKNLKTKQAEKKSGLHPRNKHATRYDFPALVQSWPELKKFISKNKFSGEDSIDFANPDAVKALNQALLKFFYNIKNWDVPKKYLCPPIPGRADYIHQIADLMGAMNGGVIPKGEKIRILDIGVGANCVYPLIASAEYGWNFVGADIDPIALANAESIITSNNLNNKITLRRQNNAEAIFKGVIEGKDFFDLTISNPPFHSSIEEAQEGSKRKIKNLGKGKGKLNTPRTNSVLNFGGQNNELWCVGGEASFITRMIEESLEFKKNCFWFTTLVSKTTTLPKIYDELKKVYVQDFKTIDMAQGQKKSRIVAWTFLTPAEQKQWRKKTLS